MVVWCDKYTKTNLQVLDTKAYLIKFPQMFTSGISGKTFIKKDDSKSSRHFITTDDYQLEKVRHPRNSLPSCLWIFKRIKTSYHAINKNQNKTLLYSQKQNKTKQNKQIKKTMKKFRFFLWVFFFLRIKECFCFYFWCHKHSSTIMNARSSPGKNWTWNYRF